MKNYYISDLHLGHNQIISACRSQFSSLTEMEEIIISNWNQKVNEEDSVYIIGDFMYRTSKHISCYISRLKGKKHLIVGNHDIEWIDSVSDMEMYFESVENMKIIEDKGREITLCHYPLLEWNHSRKQLKSNASWLIHGHIHNEKNETYKYIKSNLPNALNASVDINGFEPVTFDKLLENNNLWYKRKF